ncbi:MAG: TraR/DksA C4-type zinc finger protein [Dehalococcoidia bacterium]|jgi:RNA polymerase-binding transcription factor DksA|nr:TraR/DksA C4-type zinc finger protein [Dehalococcoidia bacterium]
MEFAELYGRLKKEKTDLLEKIEQLRALGQPSAERKEGSPFGKREEGADEASELEKRLALGQRLEESLKEVEHALEKYEAGTYGLCDSCGKPIEHARLEAIPQASLCLNCKASQAKDAKGTR